MSQQTPTHRLPQPTKFARRRLSEDVADAIKDFVVSSDLNPGDKLPTEPELVERYGVSRSVVREAGRLLVERGLVEISPGRGMLVAEFNGTSIARQYELMLELKAGSFRDLMEMRLVLEVGMARLAAERHTQEDAEELLAALDNFALAGQSQQKALEADLAFHALIARCVHNPFFEFVANPVNDYLRSAYSSSLGYEAARSCTLDEHRAIADAVLARDGDRASELSRLHLQRILDTRRDLVADSEQPDPSQDGERP
ncbi:transcriptional regulator, GntR family [Nocardioides sp. JS614]|nr:transcriptional regulator, GntR family [Nocardioides sp. JS614]